jgi:hypothetical protein
MQLSGMESDQCWDELFIVVEGESQMIRVGWPVMMVRIQYFDLDSREEATGRIIAGR